MTTEIDPRLVMAGQTTYNRPLNAVEIAAKAAAIAHFGSYDAELAAGQRAVTFRRGFEHASYGRTEFFRTGNAMYDAGFEAAA